MIGLMFGVVVLARAACGCTIPVFRYALDRWDADPFRLVVSGRMASERETLKLLAPLRGNGTANVTVEERGEPSEQATLLFPHADVAVWKGMIDAATLGPMLDSPVRRELIARLVSGDSVVWVVAAGPEDRSAVDRIAARLRFLEQVAELPVQNPDDPDSQLGPGPELKLKFSLLECPPADPAEQVFLRTLAGPSHADRVADGVAFAAAVFGRGRVLGCWPLDELDDRTLEDATLFLTGRCSCRMKDGNPGWDLLLKVDWEHALARAAEAAADGPGPGGRDRKAEVAAAAVTVPERDAVEEVSISPPPAPVTGAAAGLSPTQLRIGGLGIALVVAFAGWRLWQAR